MGYEKRVVETRGATVEAAIEAGIQLLGVKRQDVIVEVIDEGSSGLLGLGRREAVVSLTALVHTPEAKPAPHPTPAPAPEASPEPPSTPAPPSPQADASGEGEIARSLLAGLLQRLDIQATIQVALSAMDDVTGVRVPILQVEGEQLDRLIGPRGATLDAVQLVTRAMTSQALRQRSSVLVDAAGYREQRAASLEGLAQRMAEKVMREGRALALNPMPPHERRIIHMTLRDNTAVTTKSEGEGDRRRVRIYPTHPTPAPRSAAPPRRRR